MHCILPDDVCLCTVYYLTMFVYALYTTRGRLFMHCILATVYIEIFTGTIFCELTKLEIQNIHGFLISQCTESTIIMMELECTKFHAFSTEDGPTKYTNKKSIAKCQHVIMVCG